MRKLIKNRDDVVLICACKLGNCHYISGNEKANKMVVKVKKLLQLMKIDEARVRKAKDLGPGKGLKVEYETHVLLG